MPSPFPCLQNSHPQWLWDKRSALNGDQDVAQMSVDAWAAQPFAYQNPHETNKQSPAAAMRSTVTAPATATFDTSDATTSLVRDVLSQEYCAPVQAERPDGENVPARIFAGPGAGGGR